MKNIFRFLMAVAVLFTASCAKEDISSSIGGGEVEMTFTVDLQDLGSRAYGDGTQVNTLRYYVYDNEGHFLSDLSSNPEQDKNIKSIAVGTPTTVNLVLLKGMTYNIVFWADHDGYYAYNTAAKTITVDYSRVTANEEWRDAFYAYVTIDPAADDAEDKANVTLRRPFAQLNAISTDDLTAHNNANIKLTESTVTLDVYNTFNLATGSVDTNSKVPATHLIANNVLDNSLISMNYFFASANEGYTTNVTLDVNYSNGASYSREFTYVPLKQNYRTNIIGQLLSKSTDFTVTIDPVFDKDEPESTYVATIEDLQNAINNAPEGETKIVLGADMTGNVTVIQKEGVKIIIDGNNREFDGSIKVHSNSEHFSSAALTIQNVNFETATESLNFIEALENGSERYSTNITVQNCTFEALATRSAINTAVGVQIKASKNAKVLNCTATALHSLVQAQSCDENVEVKNCKIYNGKNGVAFKQVKAAVVEGCEINATYYGIRFDGNTDNYGIVVKNNKVSAAQPLIIRKMTGQNNTITLEGTNELNTTEAYQIVITNGSDDAEYVAPTGTYTLRGADGFTLFPEKPVAQIGSTIYTNIDEAIAAWTNNSTLTLLANVTLSDVVTLKSTEHHILNLGTFTLTAADKKNAIEIIPYGDGAGTAARSCLTINADATNPGSIDAGSKACVYYKKTNGINDRIMVTINGGIYNGTISSSSNNGGQACPYFVFNGGIFNKSINLTKAMLKVTGGIFHNMFSCTGDSTAYRLISGGTFKSWTFMTADAANKFTVGTDKQVYNVGVYVNDEGYLVVGGPVITDFGDKFAAKATNATKWSSYLQYSSAAANGLYYTNAEAAIKKHGEANVVLK